MGKVLKPILLIAAVAVNIIPGVGQAVSAALFSTIGVTVSAAVALAATSAVLGVAAGAIGNGRAPTTSASQLSRLNLSFNAEAPRKIWLGSTAANTDALYQEASGSDQEYIDLIVAMAAHGVDSVSALYSEDKLMWSSAGGVASTYSGYLTVNVVTEGTRANGIPINGGARWNADCTLTGCAYIKLRVKRTGASEKASSPFSAGIPSRLTIEGKGAKVYDPRRDSTAGGSGTMRANDQTTWAYNSGGTDLGNNPALQALTFLIGWRIGGVVSVGAGIPVSRLAMADWIAAANVCDEIITTSSGSQRRYETHGTFADDDAPNTVLEALCLHMNANLRDTGGKIGIRMATNDLGGGLVTFTEDDILSGHDWQPFAPLNSSYNVVRGKWTDPAVASLYQTAPYPAQIATSPDTINRTLQLDLPMVQDPTRAQRVARQVLRREQFRGEFTADFGPRGWAVEVGQPVRLTFAAIGATSKLFRVIRQELKIIGSAEDAAAVCPMTLVEEDASIYAWSSGDALGTDAAVAAVSYLPSSQPFLVTKGADIGIDNGATRNVPRGNYDAGTTYIRGDTVIQSGSTYQLIVATSTGNAPPDVTRWMIVAAAGAGIPGATGPAGATLYTWIAFADSPNGTLNFTTGAPGNRGYIGRLDNQTTATESTNPGDYSWSPYVGPPSFGMVPSANCAVSGNRILSNGSVTAWGDGGVYSSEGYRGACSVSFTAEQTGGRFMVGINTDPTTDNSFASLDYAFYPIEGGAWIIYESATNTGVFGSYTTSTVFSIVYDGTRVVYLVDGSAVRTVTGVAANQLFYMDSAFLSPNISARILGWTAAGRAGLDGANGAPGATGPAGADALVAVATPAALTIACNSVGVVKSGQLPRTIQFQVTRNTADITASASYTHTATNCTVTDNGGGNYTITAIGADSANLAVVATSSGQTGRATATLTKVRDGSAAASVNSNVSVTTSGTAVLGGSAILGVGPSGTISIGLNLQYNISSPGLGATSVRQSAQAFYRTTPGSGTWISMGSEVAGTLASRPADIGPGEPADVVFGDLSFSNTLAGPATPANWEFAIFIRRSAGSATPSGTGLMGVSFAP